MKSNTFLGHGCRSLAAAILAVATNVCAQNAASPNPPASGANGNQAAGKTMPGPTSPVTITAGGTTKTYNVFDLRQVPSLRADQVTAASELLSDATKRLKNGDIVEAEQKLTVTNIAKPGTADWHLETTQKLMQIAGQFARENNAHAVDTTVTQSLNHLEQAANLAKSSGDAVGQARAKAAAARIYERYRGDPATAIATYQSALLLRPDDVGTKEALDRLQRSYANLVARTKSPAK